VLALRWGKDYGQIHLIPLMQEYFQLVLTDSHSLGEAGKRIIWPGSQGGRFQLFA
jgi:hypothetical protein